MPSAARRPGGGPVPEDGRASRATMAMEGAHVGALAGRGPIVGSPMRDRFARGRAPPGLVRPIHRGRHRAVGGAVRGHRDEPRTRRRHQSRRSDGGRRRHEPRPGSDWDIVAAAYRARTGDVRLDRGAGTAGPAGTTSGTRWRSRPTARAHVGALGRDVVVTGESEGRSPARPTKHWHVFHVMASSVDSRPEAATILAREQVICSPSN